MSENVQTAMLEILKNIQADLAAFRSEMAQFQTKTDQRFQHVEDALRKQRRDNAAMLIMARSVVGYFDERLTKVEGRVTALEAGHS